MNKVRIERNGGRQKDNVWIISVSVHRKYRDIVMEVLETAEFIDLMDEIGKTKINCFLSDLANESDVNGLEKKLRRLAADGRFISNYCEMDRLSRCCGCSRRVACGR